MEPGTFDETVRQNEKRIHYFIHQLGIRDVDGEYYQEGLIALWKACESHNETKSDFSTYVNWKIRNALIDRIRNDQRYKEKQEHQRQMISIEEGSVPPPEMHNEWLWRQIRERLTPNEWKWVVQFAYEDKAVAQIAAREGVTQDAVKNWGRHAKRKLKNFAPLVDER
ncbi:sigma-70 family RNA polymerase sigma factor [Salimicrobium flavidum]|uniref:RNA polymerase sigma factor, sigma-70 family n=1 Tax=Salimicrobium flavidum TaxID=570947 RepID=A0A1N7J0H0_9BACI|nr:sigma-70 family RNA polymerase sigma factor [Salimicrobium flavidum]SIS42810.1 RNA polymerase sigma factor, sigma-70 family [Salimicrobium flavidum]